MGRIVICVVSLLAASVLTGHAVTPAKLGYSILLPPPTGNVAALAGLKADIIVRFVSAMRRFRQTGGSRGSEFAIPFQPSGEAAIEGPWTWSASNGNRVRRLNNGAFHISAGTPANNWFVEFACEVAEWPNLTCDDGRRRRMLVVDVSTIEIDGVRYRRDTVAAD